MSKEMSKAGFLHLDGGILLYLPLAALAKALGVSEERLKGLDGAEVLNLLGLDGIGKPDLSDEEVEAFRVQLGFTPQDEKGED